MKMQGMVSLVRAARLSSMSCAALKDWLLLASKTKAATSQACRKAVGSCCRSCSCAS